LEAALARLAASGIPTAGRQAIEGLLRAAANPDAERIDVVVNALEADRQRRVLETALGVTSVTNRVLARARQALLDMPEDEWNRLVEEANQP
jgi:hypothetical protein